jgi:CheY-like chemotaxis protein
VPFELCVLWFILKNKKPVVRAIKHVFPRFLIIDNATNATALAASIAATLKNADIRIFQNPDTLYEFIVAEYSGKKRQYAILFMDIDLDPLSTWEFMERFAVLDPKIRAHVSIIALSHSLDLHEKEKALSNRHVKNYIEKPLSNDLISQMFL